MTPLQLQRYSDYKKQYRKDIVLDRKNKNYSEKSKEVQLYIDQNSIKDFELINISKNLTFFFYDKK